MSKVFAHKKRRVAPKKDVKPAHKKVVLVGTYKTRQLESWPGYYNYPLFKDDDDNEASWQQVNELWLFKGKTEGRYFAAECLGVKTRDELKEFGYKANGEGRSDRYVLFKIAKTYAPAKTSAALAATVEKVIVRIKDFKTAPKVQKQLKAYLESSDRKDSALAKQLPTILVKVPSDVLRVCEAAVQLDFFLTMGDCVSQNVPFPPPKNPKFTFVDLFAGIGGFHLAMHQLGGKCVFACEWDKDAQETYAKNYGIAPAGDITKINERDIPMHDVLCAGFPCQAFSKAGKQLGFADETKGTLFFDVERILAYHRTKYIVLENVRNLVSHDDGNTWRTIYSHLVKLGYRLTPEPLIVSPHYFGIPQLRERVVVLGVYDPAHAKTPLEIKLPKFRGKSECSLDTILEKDNRDPSYKLTDEEVEIIDIWDEFYHGIKEKVIGFPVWLDWFKTPPPPSPEMPEWKRTFVKKNNQLYLNNKKFIDAWLKKHDNLAAFTPTMRKMEWQCGKSVGSAWEAFMQQRPSGLRIKRPDCAPALVAIVQVPIIGKYKRRMTLLEAARLQSFDDKFIPCTNRHQAYKQFGNAVNVTVIKECARRLFEYE